MRTEYNRVAGSKWTHSCYDVASLQLQRCDGLSGLKVHCFERGLRERDLVCVQGLNLNWDFEIMAQTYPVALPALYF